MKKEDKSLAITMLWVTLCMLAVLAIAIYSNHIHSQKPKQQVCDTIVVYDTVLVSLADSVHYYEDGM